MLARALVLVLALCFAATLFGQTVDVSAIAQLRTISVTGTGRVYATPDEAVLNVGVSEESRELKEAKADVDQAGKAVLDAVRKLGVEQKDIQTDNLQIRLVMEDQSSMKTSSRRQRTYVVDRSYRVTMRDAGKIQDVYDTVAAAGATSVYGPIYQTSQLRQHRDEARKLALESARQKALDMAAVLGCSLAQVRSIRETAAIPFYSNAVNAQAQVQSVGAPEEPENPTPMGQIAITAEVEVVFDLVNGK